METIYKSEVNNFEVIEFQGRYYLYVNGTRGSWDAQLITGETKLKEKYNNSFEVWYTKCRKSKIKLMNNYEKLIEEMEEKIKFIKYTWRI